jgi:hypothetical protein
MMRERTRTTNKKNKAFKEEDEESLEVCDGAQILKIPNHVREMWKAGS